MPELTPIQRHYRKIYKDDFEGFEPEEDEAAQYEKLFKSRDILFVCQTLAATAVVAGLAVVLTPEKSNLNTPSKYIQTIYRGFEIPINGGKYKIVYDRSQPTFSFQR